MASIHCSLSSWHHQPGHAHAAAVEKAGSGLKVKPVENTSQASGLLRRCTSVAQSTTCRSILKPAASSCCLATSAFLNIHWYSLVVSQRTGVPFVPRGAGTGLSGGALANDDAVLMVLTRLNRILAIDPRNRIAVVEPGVVNVRLSADR